MITSKNDANSSLYVALFKEAYDFLRANYSRLDADRQASCEALFALRGEDGRFTSVQEYFSHLKDIYDAGGKKYLMLPLDEPVFEIDANSRDIAVPPIFKKNGVSVEGDSIAETLIFRINRFFDYADLYSMNCQIVWEASDKQTQGVDDAFLVDATTDADHLYIMWPLKYSVTKKPGTVKFSVRFHNSQNGGQPSYSFSTKVAAITINAGQSFFDLNSQAGWTAGYDNANQEFYNSIVNSQDIGADDAKPPYFVFNLDNHGSFDGGEGENYMFIDTTSAIPTIEAYVDKDDNTSQTLRVEAATNDTGMISYKWYYIDTLDTERSQNGVMYELIPTTDYQKTGDTVKVANKVYYKKTGENTYAIADFDASTESHEDLYEKYSTVVVSKGQRAIDVVTPDAEQQILSHVVGKYFAKAINTVGANTDTTDSYVLVFPSPSKPVITTDLDPNGYLGANGLGSIKIEADIDAHGAKASYDWLYSATANGGFTPIFGETSTLTEAEKAKFSTNEDGNVLFIDNMPGFYKVTVISTRNYDTASTASEVTSKVTMPVGAPVVLVPTANVAVSNAGATGAKLTVKVQPYENLVYTSDQVTYQWYTYDKTTGEEIAIEGTEGVWDNASDIVYTVPHGADYQGGYFCKIVNHIGNKEATTETADFSVTIFNPETAPSQVVEDEPVTLPPVTVRAGKQFTVAADDNQAASEANQAAISVTQDGNNVTINGSLDALTAFTTTQGEGKWIGLTLKTNLTTINGATLNGVTLDLDDVNAVADAGLGNDTILYWIKAETLTAPVQLTIGASAHESVTITVSFEDTQG